MASTVIGFPGLNSPFVDPTTGLLQQAWYQFLLTLWSRTGSGTGTTDTDQTSMALALEDDSAVVDTDRLQGLGMGLTDDTVDEVDQAFLQGLAMGLLVDTPDSQTAGAISTETVGASPWTYTAGIDGNLLIKIGTVSQIDLIRGGTFTTGLTAGFIPLAPGDQCTVTYTAVPTVYFIPSGKDSP